MGKKLYEDDVLVIGLGRFGGSVAVELQRLGHHVVAVERDHELAETFLGKVTKIVQADASQPQSMAHLKARSFKLAVVGIGSSVEASVLCAMNLVDAGIPTIWAKSLSPEHARILERIGVHHVISPEAESGRRVAHLLNGKLMDYIEFDDGFAIVKMKPPQEAIGFTLAQSQIRSKYGVTVVGVKAPEQDFTYAVPETKVTAHDTLIVSGPTDLLDRLASRP
ncbi:MULTISPECIES: potassium channel family protein [unclassified Phycicoccus]|uniref:potassium channel family protein n=1 Tax=unclassified Phycicoccus TaxID=2637926 RepID=UPI0007037191|nr:MULTISPECIES: TrkA family potassium uptake protein [unclassified Phycicoccus]KQU65504.1 potassium transporter [Phycicoccus sp. Root101]KQZ89369.1 potassium transporter [Phycicoccus sp. Root563]